MLRVACFLLAGLLLAPATAGAQPEALPFWGQFDRPYERGRIGLRVQPMTPELREHMKAPLDAGVLVVQVEAGGPAAKAGVRVGDVITEAGGEPIEAPFELIHRVTRLGEGSELALSLVRDGETLEVTVAPRGRPWPDAWTLREWMRGGTQGGMDALQRRLDELERRLDDLERRMPERKRT